MRDRVGEGKASGNLGNTLKMLSRFDEAIEACSTHLTISRQLKDQVSGKKKNKKWETGDHPLLSFFSSSCPKRSDENFEELIIQFSLFEWH